MAWSISPAMRCRVSAVDRSPIMGIGAMPGGDESIAVVLYPIICSYLAERVTAGTAEASPLFPRRSWRRPRKSAYPANRLDVFDPGPFSGLLSPLGLSHLALSYFTGRLRPQPQVFHVRSYWT